MIDPLDGTINYYHRMSPFRIGMCLLEDNLPIISAVYNPIKEELFLAEKDQGATLNDCKLKVNDNSGLRNSMIMIHLS